MRGNLNPSAGRRRAGPCRRHRGISSIMATFYVMLFAALAIAYTALSGSNVQASGNTRSMQLAVTAAESGMSVLRYHIAGMVFDGEATGEQIFAALGQQLAAAFNGTLNVQGGTVTYDADQISVPWVAVDESLAGSSFSATIGREDAAYRLTVTGRYNGVARTVTVLYQEASGPGSGGFPTHGIISRGTIDINGSAVLRSNVPGGSSVMSLDPDAWRPIHINGSGLYDGDFYTVKDDVDAGDIFNGSHLFLDPQTGDYLADGDAHVHDGIDEPAWPEVDTATFANLIAALPHTVLEENYGDADPLGNVLIPANANVRFNGATTINGLVYVEWPNDIRFNGSLDITGMIVFAKPPFEPDLDDAPTNNLTFNGTVTAQGPESLPDTAEYAGLRDKLNTFLLAPDVEVLLNGAFGNIVGSLYTSGLRMNGATSGTIRGSIILDRRREFSKNGSMNVYFEVDPEATDLAGLVFAGTKVLQLLPATYKEV